MTFIRVAPCCNDKRKARLNNTNLIYEPAIVPEEQPVIPQGTARLEQPSVPLISSFIPPRQPLTDDDRTMTKVN